MGPQAPCYHRLSAVTKENPTRKLILNADDFGATRGVNDGIIRAHRDGILSSATLMAGGAAFDDAVAQAKANPSLGIGCHLVLVGEKCVSEPASIPSLADADGQLPTSLPAFVARVTSGAIRGDDIARELRAQIEKIRAAGIEPTHVDTHKHTHAHPRVMEMVCRVAKELGISRIRKPVEDLGDSWSSTESGRAASATQVVAAAVVKTIGPSFRATAEKYGMSFPDSFRGLAATGRIDEATLTQIIRTLEDGTTEIMLHPGLSDDDLKKTGTRLLMHRELEMNALLDEGVRRAIAECGVRIITYRELH